MTAAETTNETNTQPTTNNIASVEADNEKKPESSIKKLIPSKEDFINAFKLMLRFLGEDPEREGLKETPERVLKSQVEELFRGYRENPEDHLTTQFKEVQNYNQPVILKDIPIHSHCEHHALPIKGKAHIAYIPNGAVVGISKLARLTDGFARRFQIQERLTNQIGEAIDNKLAPKGVAVLIEATHGCMTERGVNTEAPLMDTTYFSGEYKGNLALQQQFLSQIANRSAGMSR